MNKILLFILVFASFRSMSQVPILLDTVNNACHVDKTGFAKDNMTYTLNGDSSINLFIVSAPSYQNAHYSRFRDPSGSPFANRTALTNWLDLYFFANALADTTSGGGGDTATLTSVTTGAGNNITPNAIQVTGFGNIDPTISSIALLDQGTNGGLFKLGGGASLGSVQITDQGDIQLASSSSTFVLRAQTGINAAASIAGRVEGENGVNSGDFVTMSQLLTLGETSTTAYRGDRGKLAYDHSQITGGTNPHNTTFANIASKPTTLSGYGITDAYPLSGNPSGFLTSVPAQSFASLTGKPTTVSGYGITDGVILGGQTLGSSLTFGTNDNNTVSVRVNNATRATFTGVGNLIVTGSYYSTNNIVTNTNSIAPTHSLTIPSVGTGIALYNTVDQTTNYERLTISKAGNVFTLNSEAGGTGTVRNVSINGSTFNSTGVTSPKFSVSALNTAPISATDTGTTGEIRITATAIFVCIATNTWIRALLTTF